MTVATYNPKTQEGLDFWDYCREVAQHTGRTTFGQLWVRDPEVNDIFSAVYSRAIVDAMFTPSPLAEFLNRGSN